MPETAKFVDMLRIAFGAEAVDGQIRRAMRGEPTFWAREAGREVGTRNTAVTAVIRYDAHGVSYVEAPDWMKETQAREGGN